ncbi:hypothetical protein Tco_1560300, partial [Tanacetum coccineum]
CLVFGHSCVNYPKKEKEVRKTQEDHKSHDGFVNVKNRKNNDNSIKNTNSSIGRNIQQNNQRRPFQKKEVVNKFVYRKKEAQGLNTEHVQKVNEGQGQDNYNTP